jgi:predicted DNA-binding WGR domain protein
MHHANPAIRIFRPTFPAFCQPKTNKPTPIQQTMITTLQSASLHFREGNSDKVYHAAIEPKGEGYLVTFCYSRRGNTLNTGIKATHPVSLAEATKIFDKLVASKIAKGYQHSAASAGETKPYQQTGDEGRDTGIRCQLLTAIDESGLSRLLGGRRIQPHDLERAGADIHRRSIGSGAFRHPPQSRLRRCRPRNL